MQDLAPGTGHLARGMDPEGYEEEARLIPVVIVPVDDDHRLLLGIEHLAQPVRRHGAGGLTTQDQDLPHIATVGALIGRGAWSKRRKPQDLGPDAGSRW